MEYFVCICVLLINCAVTDDHWSIIRCWSKKWVSSVIGHTSHCLFMMPAGSDKKIKYDQECLTQFIAVSTEYMKPSVLGALQWNPEHIGPQHRWVLLNYPVTQSGWSPGKVTLVSAVFICGCCLNGGAVPLLSDTPRSYWHWVSDLMWSFVS